jgi:hypothetical protein
MRQQLFNLACGISLVLMIAATGMWIRSYFVHDVWAVHLENVPRFENPTTF